MAGFQRGCLRLRNRQRQGLPHPYRVSSPFLTVRLIPVDCMFRKIVSRSGLVVMALMNLGEGVGWLHVVRQNQPARPDQGQKLLEIVQVAGFVSIDEQDIDGLLEPGDRPVGIALHHRDDIVHAGPLEVRLAKQPARGRCHGWSASRPWS